MAGKIGSINKKTGKVITDPRKKSSSGSAGSVSAPSAPTAARGGIPAYNAATGATSGKPSKEYTTYLRSLNKRGSPNYVSTPDDPDFRQTAIERVRNADGSITETAPPEQPQTPAGIAPTGAAAVGTPPPGSQAEMLAAGAASGDPVRMAAVEASKVSKYQQAAGSMPGGAAGMAPDNAGEVRAALTKAAPEPLDTSAVEAWHVDEGWAEIQKVAVDYLSPVKQKDTLLGEYKKMYAQSGLDELDEEIIDAETIIDGTEDDIRNEVQMAGGFATDSQVQAMALSRNKALLKRYNQLVATRESAQKRLDSMVQLSIQDKQMAMQRTNMALDVMFKQADFRRNALNDTREQYRWMAQTMGADGMYNALSKDPRQLAFAEKILGTGAGGLQSMAAQAAQQRQVAAQKDQLQLDVLRSNLQTDAAQRSKIYAEIQENKNKLAAEGDKALAKVQNRVANAENISKALKDASGRISGGSTGLRGGLTQGIYGSQAYNLRSALTTIKSNLGFSELQKMREASPTGGALGQVAVQELEALQSTVANLDVGLSEPVLRTNLNQVYKHYRGWLNTMGYELTPDFKVVEITPQ